MMKEFAFALGVTTILGNMQSVYAASTNIIDEDGHKGVKRSLKPKKSIKPKTFLPVAKEKSQRGVSFKSMSASVQNKIQSAFQRKSARALRKKALRDARRKTFFAKKMARGQALNNPKSVSRVKTKSIRQLIMERKGARSTSKALRKQARLRNTASRLEALRLLKNLRKAAPVAPVVQDMKSKNTGTIASKKVVIAKPLVSVEKIQPSLVHIAKVMPRPEVITLQNALSPALVKSAIEPKFEERANTAGTQEIVQSLDMVKVTQEMNPTISEGHFTDSPIDSVHQSGMVDGTAAESAFINLVNSVENLNDLVETGDSSIILESKQVAAIGGGHGQIFASTLSEDSPHLDSSSVDTHLINFAPQSVEDLVKRDDSPSQVKQALELLASDDDSTKETVIASSQPDSPTPPAAIEESQGVVDAVFEQVVSVVSDVFETSTKEETRDERHEIPAVEAVAEIPVAAEQKMNEDSIKEAFSAHTQSDSSTHSVEIEKSKGIVDSAFERVVSVVTNIFETPTKDEVQDERPVALVVEAVAEVPVIAEREEIQADKQAVPPVVEAVAEVPVIAEREEVQDDKQAVPPVVEAVAEVPVIAEREEVQDDKQAAPPVVEAVAEVPVIAEREEVQADQQAVPPVVEAVAEVPVIVEREEVREERQAAPAAVEEEIRNVPLTRENNLHLVLRLRLPHASLRLDREQDLKAEIPKNSRDLYPMSAEDLADSYEQPVQQVAFAPLPHVSPPSYDEPPSYASLHSSTLDEVERRFESELYGPSPSPLYDLDEPKDVLRAQVESYIGKILPPAIKMVDEEGISIVSLESKFEDLSTMIREMNADAKSLLQTSLKFWGYYSPIHDRSELDSQWDNLQGLVKRHQEIDAHLADLGHNVAGVKEDSDLYDVRLESLRDEAFNLSAEFVRIQTQFETLAPEKTIATTIEGTDSSSNASVQKEDAGIETGVHSSDLESVAAKIQSVKDSIPTSIRYYSDVPTSKLAEEVVALDELDSTIQTIKEELSDMRSRLGADSPEGIEQAFQQTALINSQEDDLALLALPLTMAQERVSYVLSKRNDQSETVRPEDSFELDSKLASASSSAIVTEPAMVIETNTLALMIAPVKSVVDELVDRFRIDEVPLAGLGVEKYIEDVELFVGIFKNALINAQERFGESPIALEMSKEGGLLKATFGAFTFGSLRTFLDETMRSGLDPKKLSDADLPSMLNRLKPSLSLAIGKLEKLRDALASSIMPEDAFVRAISPLLPLVPKLTSVDFKANASNLLMHMRFIISDIIEVQDIFGRSPKVEISPVSYSETPEELFSIFTSVLEKVKQMGIDSSKLADKELRGKLRAVQLWVNTLVDGFSALVKDREERESQSQAQIAAPVSSTSPALIIPVIRMNASGSFTMPYDTGEPTDEPK
ncbi:MAG: hypothetical protein JSR85_03040 [Proteobacteria bacterium]|nr:hypothetical protein [Pseudomonadota bacterium]